MDVRSVARAAKGPVGVLGGGFMISREVKGLCRETGLGPREMYFRGRCGVLGETAADVVTAVCVFFPASHVAESWDGGRKLPVERAVEGYAEACHNWGRRKFGEFAGAGRLADLVTAVNRHASPLGAPLFAGWRALPLPGDDPARLAQALHVLRELRGGLHGCAVLSHGLTPLEAILANPDSSGTPVPGAADVRLVAGFMNWREPYPEPGEEVRERRRRAEEATDEMTAPAFEALDDRERDELAELLAEAQRAAAGR
ncbi:SCO6745 family protein [Bailinhaonella thermotolerans]|uniref:Uncharacterized protein n=1 Tax=Bailinhaonella thermotolerans TaxID=1070861 RepID=A0A3A4ABA1_9ACTN|nr:hypothetical protein [Bailinhaonella thermotolerans]RJL26516.1 hypothetical protein D5H75_26400 [Bailinhaonella thermotolerans]